MHDVDVIIIGAGLAGLSAAVEVSRNKKRVLVLEGRSIVGGRTSSWIEKGMHVESGFHRFLGFFEALPKLLETVGVDVDDIVHWEDEIEIRLPDSKPSAVFGLSPLHKPLKSLSSMMFNNEFISPLEKTKIAAFFAHGFVDLKKEPTKLDKETVYSYAKKYDIAEETIQRVLVPVTEGLFFLDIHRYGAFNLFSLFAPYLPKLHKTRVGAFTGGMTEVMMNPMKTYVEQHGGLVQTNATVSDLIIEDGRVLGVVHNGKKISAMHVVLATSLANAQTLLRKHFKTQPFFKPMLSLPSMPSVTFQIELAKPSMDKDRTTFSPGTCLSSYTEESRTSFKDSRGRLSVILSHPEIYVRKSSKTIVHDVLTDLKRLDIAVDSKDVVDYRKITWPQDFYSYECGTDALRPPQKTPIKGLTLAGDYTRQKYMSTMEGAVVSGQLAAEHIRTL